MPAPPIYRPMARRCAPQADKSAVRQYIVRLRGITAEICIICIICIICVRCIAGDLIYSTAASSSNLGNSGEGTGRVMPSGTVSGRQLTLLISPSNPR